MRDDNRAKRIAARLRDVNPATSADDASEYMATNDLKDRMTLPTAHVATWQQYHDMCYHEAAHAVAALCFGATDIRVTVRADGSGVTHYTRD
jgi:hypothetical protein